MTALFITPSLTLENAFEQLSSTVQVLELHVGIETEATDGAGLPIRCTYGLLYAVYLVWLAS